MKYLTFTCLFMASLLLFFSFTVKANTNCVSCHQQAVSNWQQSDHAKAMDVVAANTVLGDFSGTAVAHYTQQARFYQKGQDFWINFTEADSTTDYQVKYTFGHYPLQQYLIEGSAGKLQVFPFAWDARSKEEGGQRWYPMYSQEDIQPADRLHWRQPLQNWNGMCADCHSDGLTRNYSVETKQFDTTWDNINVGCQSCHGEMTHHADTASSASQLTGQSSHGKLALSSDEQKAIGRWLLDDGAKIASWHGESRDNQFMETCFACHSLRSPITDGIDPNAAFLDQFVPSLLAPPMYHADGQIKEEVYVYGSFLQSKMYAAGVNCLDCHDKHTMKIKVQGNGLCLQCHSNEVYQQQSHLRHDVSSTAGQCVSCHMPETTYMGVDARRDHSFKVPRPDLSAKYDTPNVCTGCHEMQSSNWAADIINQWRQGDALPDTSQDDFLALMHNGTLPVARHFALINNTELSVIVRASAIAMLPNSVAQLSDNDVKGWVQSEHDLIRLAVAGIGNMLSVPERLKSYQTLLEDRFKAVRLRAANHLLDAGLNNNAAFKPALELLLKFNEVSMWRGESALNQSMVYLQLGRTKEALNSLQHGIDVDPFFAPNYVNLADVYRQAGQVENERMTLNAGLKANPTSAVMHYAHGMYLIRAQRKPDSIEAFRRAVKLAPDNVQYVYVYFLVLDGVGQTDKALRELKLALGRYHYHPQLRQLGVNFAQKMNDAKALMYFQKAK
ncbi:multiheme c-type cytochrome [Alteromonas lipotrueae]|uniref:multiheme c-type cytochrome n=1 Tax=Alteromonas lipotrueae TaxID=2803814 RepID=UPI001FE3FD3E|nr:multiheme c-type cytochrome [Alteromonas lipotrueae]